MANTPIVQTSYSYGLSGQATTVSGGMGGSLYTYPQTVTYPNTQQAYWVMPSEAEKAGKALAIMRDLESEGLIHIDSIAKFCELIDRIASKI